MYDVKNGDEGAVVEQAPGVLPDEAKTTLDTAPQVVAPTPAKLFSNRVLVRGEDADAYDDIAAQLRELVRPADIIERSYADDVANRIWEIRRLRNYKSRLINGGILTELAKFLEPIQGPKETTELVRKWFAKETQATEEVQNLLSRSGFTIEDLAARSYASLLPIVDRMDHQITEAEKQKNATLRALDQHRQNFAVALHRASEEIVDAEFEPVQESRIDEGRQQAPTNYEQTESHRGYVSDEPLPPDWEQLIGQIEGKLRAIGAPCPLDLRAAAPRWPTLGYTPRLILKAIDEKLAAGYRFASMRDMDTAIANFHRAFGANGRPR